MDERKQIEKAENPLFRLLEKSKLSQELLTPLIDEYQKIKDSKTQEDRIRKLELFTESLYHGWVVSVSEEVRTISKIVGVIEKITHTADLMSQTMEKLGTKDSNFEKEFSNLKNELDAQKDDVQKTLKPIKDRIDEYSESKERGNDIYG